MRIHWNQADGQLISHSMYLQASALTVQSCFIKCQEMELDSLSVCLISTQPYAVASLLLGGGTPGCTMDSDMEWVNQTITGALGVGRVSVQF